MKKIVYITVVLMVMVIMSIGCSATMTPEEREATYQQRKESDLRQSVGNSQFAGGSPTDSRGLANAFLGGA